MMETTMSEPGIGGAAERTGITDSFHWDVHESLGVLILGALAFYLVARLVRCYERLLQLTATGAGQPALRADNTYESHPSRPHDLSQLVPGLHGRDHCVTRQGDT